MVRQLSLKVKPPCRLHIQSELSKDILKISCREEYLRKRKISSREKCVLVLLNITSILDKTLYWFGTHR